MIPTPFYDRVVPVKESAALMALPGALVGRFLAEGEELPGLQRRIVKDALSRRARARLRAAGAVGR